MKMPLHHAPSSSRPRLPQLSVLQSDQAVRARGGGRRGTRLHFSTSLRQAVRNDFTYFQYSCTFYLLIYFNFWMQQDMWPFSARLVDQLGCLHQALEWTLPARAPVYSQHTLTSVCQFVFQLVITVTVSSLFKVASCTHEQLFHRKTGRVV